VCVCVCVCVWCVCVCVCVDECILRLCRSRATSKRVPRRNVVGCWWAQRAPCPFCQSAHHTCHRSQQKSFGSSLCSCRPTPLHCECRACCAVTTVERTAQVRDECQQRAVGEGCVRKATHRHRHKHHTPHTHKHTHTHTQTPHTTHHTRTSTHTHTHTHTFSLSSTHIQLLSYSSHNETPLRALSVCVDEGSETLTWPRRPDPSLRLSWSPIAALPPTRRSV
jgi:hypothetical protein